MGSRTAITSTWQPGASLTNAIDALRGNIFQGNTIRAQHIDDLQSIVSTLWAHSHTSTDWVNHRTYGDGTNENTQPDKTQTTVAISAQGQYGQSMTLEYQVPGTYSLNIPRNAIVYAQIIGGGGGGGGGNVATTQSVSQRLPAGTALAYSIGVGGVGGVGANNGNDGQATTLTIAGRNPPLIAQGGKGGIYNKAAGVAAGVYTVDAEILLVGGGAGGGGAQFVGGAGGTVVTFNPPTNSIGSIGVQSSNYNGTTDPANSFLKINGTRYNYTFTRGHTLAVINPTGLVVESIRTFDTYGSGSAGLASALNAVANGRIIAIGSFDATNLGADARNILRSQYGATQTNTWGSSRVSHVFIGAKNSNTAPIERISSSGGVGATVITGANGSNNSGATAGAGGAYGGGAGGQNGAATVKGGSGAVRIIYSATDLEREFPNINAGSIPGSEVVYTTPGTNTFIVPANVTRVSIVAVGAGGGNGIATTGWGAGGGGALSYANNVTVVPGQALTVVVGASAAGGNGGASYVSLNGTVVINAAGGTSGGTASGLSKGGNSSSDTWYVTTRNFTSAATFAGGDGAANYGGGGGAGGYTVAGSNGGAVNGGDAGDADTAGGRGGTGSASNNAGGGGAGQALFGISSSGQSGSIITVTTTVGVGVAGGGGGGGGGGGVYYNPEVSLTSTNSYAVTVGAGGAVGADGKNSVFDGFTATGGKAGADAPSPTQGGIGGYSGSNSDVPGNPGGFAQYVYSQSFAAYFSGYKDYLSVSNAADLNFGSRSFTVEMWFNIANKPASIQSLISKYSAASGATPAKWWGIEVTSAGVLVAGANPYGGHYITGTKNVCDGKWHHVALTRDGSSDVKLWIDGQLEDNLSDSTIADNTSAVTIGAIQHVAGEATTSRFLKGYISNLRITKGTALYTTEFTPATFELIAVQGTSLLTFQDEYFIDNSVNGYTLNQFEAVDMKSLSPFVTPATGGGGGAGTGIDQQQNFGEGYASLGNTAGGGGQGGSYTINNTTYTVGGGGGGGAGGGVTTNNYAAFFNGSSSYVAIPANSAFDFAGGPAPVTHALYTQGRNASVGILGGLGKPEFGTTGDFTLEFFTKNNTLGSNGTTATLIDNACYSTTKGYYEDGSFVVYQTQQTDPDGDNDHDEAGEPFTRISLRMLDRNNYGTVITCNVNLNYNTWYHVAIACVGTTVTMYIDGTARGTWTKPVGYRIGYTEDAAGVQLYVGAGNQRANGAAIGPFTGYISNLRYVVGGSVYNGNFTKPLAPLGAITSSGRSTPILTLKDTTYTDVGGSHTVTAYNSPSLVDAVDLGTVLTTPINFTIEFWMSPQTRQVGELVDFWTGGVGAWQIQTQASGQLTFYLRDSVSHYNLLSTRGAIPLSSWTHVALTRDNGKLSFWVNGVLENFTTASWVTGQIGSATSVGSIGAQTNSNAVRNNFFNGYLSNLRITKGYALYDHTFNVTGDYGPIVPYSPVTGTVLLTLQSATFIDNSTNHITLSNYNATALTAFGSGGRGGNGGGGTGGTVAVAGTNGTNGTGGGGGGGSGAGRGTGGSGRVIISYESPTGSPLFTGGTVTNNNGIITHDFTSSGTLTKIGGVVYYGAAGGTASGGQLNWQGGDGGASYGDRGGAGGGAIGGGHSTNASGASGTDGGIAVDRSGLKTATLTRTYRYFVANSSTVTYSYQWTGPGLGDTTHTTATTNSENGGSAVGRGFGHGGGGAQYYGGNGGDGWIGGGGGGAAGYQLIVNGGRGGDGAVVVYMTQVTNPSNTQTVVITPADPPNAVAVSGTYNIPAGWQGEKIWVIGAGGGGAGSIAVDTTAGGGGGAGGMAIYDWERASAFNLTAGGTGGGGGAGGYYGNNTESALIINNTNYDVLSLTIKVGAGGAGGSLTANGVNGTDSYVFANTLTTGNTIYIGRGGIGGGAGDYAGIGGAGGGGTTGSGGTGKADGNGGVSQWVGGSRPGRHTPFRTGGHPGNAFGDDSIRGIFGGGGAGGYADTTKAYAGTTGGDGYVKLVLNNFYAPGAGYANLASRSNLVVTGTNDVIRAAHVNNLYQNLVNFAGQGHTHTIGDNSVAGVSYYVHNYYYHYWWWGWSAWAWYWWWWY